MSSGKPAPIASEVDILKTKAAAKRGVGAVDGKTETIWPKCEFGPSTKIDFITKQGKEADGFIIPAGSMFPLGCAIPNHTTLQHGMYFPPGSMFPDGVLVPIHARMVSVQPIQTLDALPPAISGAVDAVREKVLTKPREPEDWLKASEVEEVAEDEDKMIEEIGQTMRRIQQKNFDAHGHFYRGTHVKSLAFVKGTLQVSPDLPQHLQQGIFQPSAAYPVIARYANEPSFVKADTENAPRGLGVKVFDVPGEPLLDGEEYATATQDLLFNNAPMVELTDVKTTLEIQQIRERNFDSVTGLAAELAKRSDRSKQFAPAMLPNEYVIGATMYSQAAFAYGPYAAKYSLAPKAPQQTELTSKTIPSDASATFHRDHLHDYFASNPATYSFRVQFTSDLKTHPVEDASVPWDEVMAPWHEVAEITFDQQESLSDARRVWWEDRIALSPWNGVKDHRPLGGINRLRKRVYEFTREGRERNGKTVCFPKSVDEFPQ